MRVFNDREQAFLKAGLECIGKHLLRLVFIPASVKAGVEYLGARWNRFGPPRPRNPACEDAAAFSSVMRLAPANTGGAAEVYASPSLQVGFAALVPRPY